MAQRVVVSDKEFLVAFSNDEKTQATVNGNEISIDVKWLSNTRLHIIKGVRSYEVELLEDADGVRKIKVNGNLYGASVIDAFDELLNKMGFKNGAAGKVSELKAPMPGLVLELAVSAGDAVKKGDRMLVLEAMKMENVIKSPADGTVASVEVEKGNTVEKNEVMIRFA
ncbi:biotin/lipoyl-containing protein [Bacteroidota bacterium]